mgnify:CR=1 FL=1
MGRISGQLSEITLITDDNPRSEEPATIRAESAAGCREVTATHQIEQIGCRKEAIIHALTLAKPGDTVLLAGKGHETDQITATGKQPFDDRKTALEGLLKLGYTG